MLLCLSNSESLRAFVHAFFRWFDNNIASLDDKRLDFLKDSSDSSCLASLRAIKLLDKVYEFGSGLEIVTEHHDKGN